MSNGFQFGPAHVAPLAHIEGRGYAVGVDVGKRRLQIWISEGGRSVRVFEGNVELMKEQP